MKMVKAAALGKYNITRAQGQSFAKLSLYSSHRTPKEGNKTSILDATRVTFFQDLVYRQGRGRLFALPQLPFRELSCRSLI